MLKRRYLMGIDAGTSMVKVVVFDLDGTELGSGEKAVAVDTPHPGWAQQDPAAVWEATAFTIGTAIRSSGVRTEEIAVVGPCGQGDGAWFIDETGRPMTPTPLWNDGRAAELLSDWEATGLLKRIFHVNGTQLWSGAAAPLISWYQQHGSTGIAPGSTLFCCKDWIKFKLTGTITTDESDGSIPFMDLAKRQYDPRLPDWMGLTDNMPKLAPLVPSHKVVGEVTAAAARKTGLAQGTPVVSGMLDVAANAVGAGVIEAGQAITIMGTTSLNMVVQADANSDPQGIGATTCHGVPGRWMRILGAMTGTPNLDWYIDNLGPAHHGKDDDDRADIFKRLEAAVGKAPVGAGGVLFHPYLFGERAPFVNSLARAAFFGIQATTTNDHLLRAIYEGIAFSARDCYQKVPQPLSEITLVGGGARSRVWCQTLADVLGCKMIVPRGSQFGALGAAITGAVGIGLFQNLTEGVDKCLQIEHTFEPIAQHQRRYDDLYRLYAHLIELLQDYWKESQAVLRNWEEQGGSR
jgi:sugar (pentulose or hexulose) kinase